MSITLRTTLSSHFSVTTSSHCYIYTLLCINCIDYIDDISDRDNGSLLTIAAEEEIVLVVLVAVVDEKSERCVCRIWYISDAMMLVYSVNMIVRSESSASAIPIMASPKSRITDDGDICPILYMTNAGLGTVSRYFYCALITFNDLISF